MRKIVCPHCNAARALSNRVPRDVVAVMPCPKCHELAVYYRGHGIALNRHALFEGTKEERRDHLADVIGQFLDAGGLPTSGFDLEGLLAGDASDRVPEAEAPDEQDPFDGEDMGAITQQEVDKFTRIDLKCIDNPAYFRKHFG